MSRGIYEIKLKEHYFPALSEEDALEMQAMGERPRITPDSVEVSCVVKEEDTMKMFVVAKTLYDAELFESNEIEAAIRSLAIEMGYYANYSEITDCVLTWCERFMDLSINELQEWIIG